MQDQSVAIRSLAEEGYRTKVGFLRFFARYFDLFICIGIPFAFLPVDSLDSVMDNRSEQLLLGLALHVFTAAVEAASASRFATSPGKWLLGLEIKSSDGSNATFWTIFERYFVVFSIGQACMVPLVSLLVGVFHLRRFTRKGTTTWDERYATAVTWQGFKWKRLAYAALTLAALDFVPTYWPF